MKLFDEGGQFRRPEGGPATEGHQPHFAGDPHYDEDLPGEIVRMHNMLEPKEGESYVDSISRHLSKSIRYLNLPNSPPKTNPQSST